MVINNESLRMIVTVNALQFKKMRQGKEMKSWNCQHWFTKPQQHVPLLNIATATVWNCKLSDFTEKTLLQCTWIYVWISITLQQENICTPADNFDTQRL